MTVFDKDLRNTCPECGNWLSHEGGCTSCKSCGWGACGYFQTFIGLGVMLVCLAVVVLA